MCESEKTKEKDLIKSIENPSLSDEERNRCYQVGIDIAEKVSRKKSIGSIFGFQEIFDFASLELYNLIRTFKPELNSCFENYAYKYLPFRINTFFKNNVKIKYTHISTTKVEISSEEKVDHLTEEELTFISMIDNCLDFVVDNEGELPLAQILRLTLFEGLRPKQLCERLDIPDNKVVSGWKTKIAIPMFLDCLKDKGVENTKTIEGLLLNKHKKDDGSGEGGQGNTGSGGIDSGGSSAPQGSSGQGRSASAGDDFLYEVFGVKKEDMIKALPKYATDESYAEYVKNRKANKKELDELRTELYIRSKLSGAKEKEMTPIDTSVRKGSRKIGVPALNERDNEMVGVIISVLKVHTKNFEKLGITTVIDEQRQSVIFELDKCKHEFLSKESLLSSFIGVASNEGEIFVSPYVSMKNRNKIFHALMGKSDSFIVNDSMLAESLGLNLGSDLENSIFKSENNSIIQ